MDRSVFANGSSPLTRGKREITPDVSVDDGLIPAHAGKTSHHPLASGRGAAHPRSRGENGGCLPNLLPALGSSPLTRGKHHGCADRRAHPRLIPAHAGKTLGRLSGTHSEPAHPRSRGENGRGRKRRRLGLGSSPLTRGKRLRTDDWHDSSRLIPAHAGKTSRRRSRLSSTGAHPRSRGENRA